jgi:hypothetical protein
MCDSRRRRTIVDCCSIGTARRYLEECYHEPDLGGQIRLTWIFVSRINLRVQKGVESSI